MEFYKVVVAQELFGQSTIVGFNYVLPSPISGQSGSSVLAEKLGYDDANNSIVAASTVLQRMRSLQSTAVSFVSMEVFNLYNPDDFITVPFSDTTNGLSTGLCSSPTLAYAWSTTRVTRAIRRGQKRLPGVPFPVVSDGGIIASEIIDTMAIVGAQFASTITTEVGGVEYVFSPAILGVEKYTTPSGKFAYRPYATAALQAPHVATGFQWVPKNRVSTQASRQYS